MFPVTFYNWVSFTLGNSHLVYAIIRKRNIFHQVSSVRVMALKLSFVCLNNCLAVLCFHTVKFLVAHRKPIVY